MKRHFVIIDLDNYVGLEVKYGGISPMNNSIIYKNWLSILFYIK